MKITVTKKAEKKFNRKYPLIQAEDLKKSLASFPKEWVTFVSEQQQYIATGYLGKQNKGIGWLVNWQGEINGVYLEKLFAQAKEARYAYAHDPSTTAYRLFNGEGDGLGGVTIDRYDNFVVFSWYNDTLYFKKNDIVSAFKKVFPEIIGAYEKIRFVSKELPESQKLYGNEAPEPLYIMENGIHYATYLNDGLMTGIFLDQKEVRARLSEGFAAGKNVLNMFSYTGAFSVASAMGGASETTSVDLAKRSITKTKEQFEVNQLNLDFQKIIVMDVFDYFKYAFRKNYTYDLIIIDPPSFARNKKKVFSVSKHYGELIAEALQLIKDEGTIIASTNAANLSINTYRKMIQKVLEKRHVNYIIEEIYRLPDDFKVHPKFNEGNYLKVFFIKIKK